MTTPQIAAKKTNEKCDLTTEVADPTVGVSHGSIGAVEWFARGETNHVMNQ